MTDALHAALGVYVHLPYCTSLCPYCDFNSYVQPAPPWPDMQRALLHELATRAPLFAPHGPAQTLYFGGGTPSLAPPAVIDQVIAAGRAQLALQANAEITLEANPGSVDVEKLSAYRAAGVNRISLGWQSTHDRLLRVLGRGHSAQDARDAYVATRAAGFDNVSMDLIFAVPSQTLDELDADLDAIVAHSPEHVSLYALTYHAGTPFYRRRARGRLTPAPEELEVAMMERIEQRLTAVGYQHYEVSNYARPGREARHNSLYWQGGRYVGIGPGAHSFYHDQWQQGWRWEGCRKPQAYIDAWQSVKTEPLPQDGLPEVTWCETLDAHQMMTERLLCGMRLAQGIDTREPVVAQHAAHVRAAACAAQNRGWVTQAGATLRPTALGLRHADALAALFF